MGKIQREGQAGRARSLQTAAAIRILCTARDQSSGAIDPDVVVDAELWVEVKFVQRIAAGTVLGAGGIRCQGWSHTCSIHAVKRWAMDDPLQPPLPDLARIMQARADEKESHEQRTHTTADPEPESPTD